MQMIKPPAMLAIAGVVLAIGQIGLSNVAKMADPRADRDLPVRQRFEKAKSYCCYYGAGHVAELSHFDAVILHARAEQPDDVRKLSARGVITIGYLSVGEDEGLRVANGRGPGGTASWYFDKNHTGQPDRNGAWNSYFANANDPAWRADRVAEARRLCGRTQGEYGFDGVFLDTIETIDSYPQSRPGMIQLLADIRAALPDKVIVINRGFSLLGEDAVISRIDGLMFESFTDSFDFKSKNYVELGAQDLDNTRNIMESVVAPAVKKYGFRVLALDYVPKKMDRIQRAFDRALSFNMVPGVAPMFLDEIYDTSGITTHSQRSTAP
jgi:hypothetical protein